MSDLKTPERFSPSGNCIIETWIPLQDFSKISQQAWERSVSVGDCIDEWEENSRKLLCILTNVK